MKKIIYVLFLISAITTYAQIFYAPNGVIHTPTGNLKFLVVVAATPYDCTDGNCSNASNVINMNDYFYTSNTQFNNNATDLSISNFFYQSSRHHPTNAPFRITGGLFPDVVTVPTWLDNYAVLKKIATSPQYSSYDFSSFDTRTNIPNGFVNNSTSTGDHVIDYIIILWKNNDGCTARTNSCGGYASAVTYPSPGLGDANLAGNYSTSAACGFTLTLLDRANFIHEFAHQNYESPHYAGANAIEGPYFRTNNGYGMMQWGKINCTPLAWESWYNGWIELPKTTNYNSTSRDLDNYLHNGTYNLKDFMSTGDAMRIKLPFVNQYLWVEYHNRSNVLDYSTTWNSDGLGNSIPGAIPGLLMYVERIAYDRNTELNLTNNLVATNGIKFLHGEGNFDFGYSGYNLTDPVWWNNPVINFTKGSLNPAGLYNKLSAIKYNYPSDLETKLSNITTGVHYPDNIVSSLATNSYGKEATGTCYDFASLLKPESSLIVKLDGLLDYSNLGRKMAFGVNNNLGLSYSSLALNHQMYDPCTSTWEPAVLNGISVSPMSTNSDGTMTIQVKFDDTKLYSNPLLNGQYQRFAGNLEVKDIENASYDLDIQGNLLINPSATPDRHTKNTDGTFINRSAFTITNPSKVNIVGSLSIVGSDLNVWNGSEIVLNNGASINIQNSNVCIENPDNLVFSSGSTYVNNGVTYQGNISINSGDVLTSNYKAFNKINYYHNTLDLASSTLNVTLKAGNLISFKPGAKVKPIGSQKLTAQIDNLYSRNCVHGSQMRLEAPEKMANTPVLLYCQFDDFRYTNEVKTNNTSSKANNFKASNEMLIYPNPNDGSFSINFPSSEAAYEVQIVDLLGNVVLKENLSNILTKNYSLTNLSNGMYIVNLTGDGVQKRTKVQVIR